MPISYSEYARVHTEGGRRSAVMRTEVTENPCVEEVVFSRPFTTRLTPVPSVLWEPLIQEPNHTVSKEDIQETLELRLNFNTKVEMIVEEANDLYNRTKRGVTNG